MPSSIELGIDYSTTNMLIYQRDKGIIFDEPAAIAFNRDTKQILAIGREAAEMIGRTPENIAAIRPLHSGGIINFDMTAELLRLAVMKVIKKKSILARPRAVISLPISIHEKDKEALVRILFDTGMKKTQLMHKGIAACLGAGIKIDKSRRLIVDVSGGTTDVMVISNRIATGEYNEYSSKSLDKAVSGDSFTRSIVSFFENSHSLHIPNSTADQIKEDFATLYANEGSPSVTVWGRNKLTGMLQYKSIRDSDIAAELIPPATTLVNFIQAVINVLNPQEALDVQNNGIFLTGGGAMLRGLGHFVETSLQLKTNVSYSPQFDTILGLGYALENPQEVKDYLRFAHSGIFG